MGNSLSKVYGEVGDNGTTYRFYRLICYRTNKTYIGKTIKSLDERLASHICDAINYNPHLDRTNDTEKWGEKNCGSFGIVYKTIRGVDYDIELIKEHILCDNLEARITEQIYLDEERLINVGNVVNIKEAYVSIENQIKKEKKYQNDKYANDKEYREHRKIYSINYGNTHRENINKKSNERVVCELCGGEYTRSNKWAHIKNSKHKSKIN